jgi:LPPG:FO 2-phospho-L-lactate transferase
MPDPLTVAVLAGGVGAARLLTGLVTVVEPALVTAIVNVGDDETLHGLRISPDLDTITYTVSGAIDTARGWGLTKETWGAMGALHRYTESAGRPDLGWFNLGDQDLGTHMYRTSRLAEGATLAEVTAEITVAWGLGLRVVPVSNQVVATRLVSPTLGELAFQEYFVREQHGVEVSEVRLVGAESASPAPGVLVALATSDVVIIAPSNPIVSIGPVLAVPGVHDAVVARRDRCVAVSPIVGGAALKGPADRLLRELGHEVSAVGVARLYRDVASVLVVDTVDAELAPAIEAEGMRCVVAPSIMTDAEAAGRLSRVCLDAVA